MKSLHAIALVFCFVAVGNSQGVIAHSPEDEVAQVFRAVLPALKQKVGMPILLPSALPKPIDGAKEVVVREADERRYSISLYYRLGVGDSGFAAFFSANADAKYSPRDLGNVREVKLNRGVNGFFRAISCGGSCAPVNLWWIQDGIVYQIQLRLSSTTTEADQEKAIIGVANSAIAYGPR